MFPADRMTRRPGMPAPRRPAGRLATILSYGHVLNAGISNGDRMRRVYSGGVMMPEGIDPHARRRDAFFRPGYAARGLSAFGWQGMGMCKQPASQLDAAPCLSRRYVIILRNLMRAR